MGANAKKYYYITRVGLVRGSWGEKQFLDDLEFTHMQDHPGKLVAMRLTEYYQLRARLLASGQLSELPELATSQSDWQPAQEQGNQKANVDEAAAFDEDLDALWSV